MNPDKTRVIGIDLANGPDYTAHGQIVKPATSGRQLVTFEEIFGRPRTEEEIKKITADIIKEVVNETRKNII